MQHRWNLARRAGAALVLGFASLHAGAGNTLPAITFLPAAPVNFDQVTAVLPFQICSWTIDSTPGHIDIDYIPAPCPMQMFTDKIPLGSQALGTYAVVLNLLQQQGSVAQAAGTLTVTGSIGFSPADPIAGERITAFLNAPGCGDTTATVSGFQINATTVPHEVCFSAGPPITVTFGPLPPGAYQMTWFMPAQLQVATAPLVVTQAVVASTPALDPHALLGLMLGLGLLAACSLRRRQHV